MKGSFAMRTPAPSTAELVQHCLQGDANAWRALVERYARLVHSIPARQGLPPAEVDDIGQEVFLALAQNLHTIEDPDRLASWLVTTTRRTCWRFNARRHNYQPLDDGSGDREDDRPMHRELISPLPTPEEALSGWQRQETIHRALAQLRGRCHDLITLIFLDPSEPSYDEISERLNIPKGSIGPTRTRCLNDLRSLLSDEEMEA